MKNPGCEYQYGSKRKRKRADKPESKLRSIMPSVLMTLLALMSAALLVLSLFLRAELTEINDKNVELKSELGSLREENRRLRIEYEFSQDLDALERDAKSRLGMQNVLQRQEEMIYTAPEDKAVIINNG